MPSCPVCKTDLVKEVWRYQDYTILGCSNCLLQFTNPMQGGSADYYEARYIETGQAILQNSIHPGVAYILKRMLDTVDRYLVASQRRVIDVGCGNGYLLSELAKRRFDCLGIDFNPDAIRIAQEHFHLNAQVGRIEDLVALDSKFDFALLIHVLEHVEDPLSLLRNIRQVLAPNGILLVDLPNRDRFAIRRSLTRGEMEPGEYPPHHLTFWSTASLVRALQLTGYSVIECHPRPFNEENQVGLFLSHRLRLPGRVTAALSRVIGAVGRLLGLQGGTIYAVARRVD